MKSSDFETLYKNIIKNINDYRADYLYPQKFPFKLSNRQIDKILNIPYKEEIFKLKDIDELKLNYEGYFSLCLAVLSFNDWEYCTIDRVLKILNEFIKLGSLGIKNNSVQEISSRDEGDEINEAFDAVQLLLIKHKFTKEEKDIIEKFIEDNIDYFLEDFMYESHVYGSYLDIPKFLASRLQSVFPFSTEFIKRNYKYFSIYEIYYNKEVMKDLDVQRIVFGEIRENTFNSLLNLLTVGDVKEKPFKVTEEEILASLLKYNT